MNNFVKCIIVVSVLLCSAFGQIVNYPFPQKASYQSGLVYTGALDVSLVQATFDDWWDKFYEEQGNLARIRWENPSKLGETVSEGMAYGMLLAVYYSTATKSYEPEFQKLWAYYQKFSNNMIMHWHTQGFTSVLETGGATDAELDAAVALIMAAYQFSSNPSSSTYMSDAKKLIEQIRAREVSGNLLKPGDQWDDKKNPSYSSLVALELFQDVDGGNSSTWSSVLSGTLGMLENNQRKSSAGLWSDWCDPSGNTLPHWDGQTRFGYDAARTPWRVQWHVYWHGNSRSKAMNAKLTPLVSNLDYISRIKGPVTLSGSFAGHHNTTFVGAFANAWGSTTNQAKFNEFYNHILVNRRSDRSNYYNGSLRAIYVLLLAGMMPDLSNHTNTPYPTASSSSSVSSSGTVSSSAVTSSSVSTSSSTAASSSSQAEPVYLPCASVSGLAVWETYVDNLGSSVTPAPGSIIIRSENGSNVASANFSIKPEPSGAPYPFVGMLVNFDEGGFRYNLSSVSSISVEYKSTGDIRLSLLQFGVTGTGAEYGIHLLPSSAYKNQTIQISQLKQPDWVSTTPERQAPLEMDKILGAKFELKSNTGGSGSVSIRKLVFNGFTPPEVLCEDYTAIGSDFSAKSSPKRVQINAQYTNGTLQISQPFSGNMQISLVGLNGKEVVQIHSGYTEAGLMIMPLQVPAGVYYIRAQSDLGVQVKQLFITQ